MMRFLFCVVVVFWRLHYIVPEEAHQGLQRCVGNFGVTGARALRNDDGLWSSSLGMYAKSYQWNSWYLALCFMWRAMLLFVLKSRRVEKPLERQPCCILVLN